MIVGLYVFTPFLQVFVSAASRQSLLLLILIAMAIGSIESMLGVISATFLSRFLPYVGYFLVGYYLRESEIGVQTRILFLLAFAFGTLISIGTGLLLPKIGPRSWELMYDYLNPLVVLMSVCVFSIGLRTNLTGPAPIVFSNKIAPLSFGIYLVHPIWLWMSGHYFPWAFSEFPIITIPANTLAIFLLSALSILAISRIPLLRRTV
jgi:surface polysaccharide O-acyltransferase-like enzyme